MKRPKIWCLTVIAWLIFTTFSSASHYHVYLLGGQSNAVGRGDAAQLFTPLNEAQTDVRFYWHRTQNATNTGHLAEDEWIDLAPGSGLGGSEPVYPMEFGSEVSFGRAMADAKPTDHVAIIKYCHAGTTLGGDWSPTGEKYATFVSTVQAGLAALAAAMHTCELKGMLWMQGETDTKIAAFSTAYEANLVSLISRVRTDLFSGESLPFIIGTLSDSQFTDIAIPGTGSYKVRQAQEKVAAGDAKVGLVVTDGFSVRSDIIHFDHNAQIALGQGFAAEMSVLEGLDLVAPRLFGTSPGNGAACVPVNSTLEATFDEEIDLTGSGSVTIRNLGSGPDVVIALPNAQVSVSGNELIIDPARDLLPETSYAIRIGADAVVDQAEPPNAFGGIANDTTWSFSTVPAGFTVSNTTASGFTVSNGDLLQTALTSVTASDLTQVGASTLTGETTLRDGVWDNETVDGVESRSNAGVQDGDYAEYFLDLSASPGGYSVSQIDLYSNWGSGSEHDEIRVTIDYSLVGSPTVFDRNIVNAEVYNPVSDGTMDSTQARMSIAGIDAAGVAAIRFSWPSPQENGAVGYSELDVFGAACTDDGCGCSQENCDMEIDVQGNGVSICDGDTSPDAADDTDFGDVPVDGGTVSHTFTISNDGDAELTLSGNPLVEIGGANAADFEVTADPTSPVAASGGTTTFTVQFDPSDSGLREAKISIGNNDAGKSPYDFAIQGTGKESWPDLDGDGQLGLNDAVVGLCTLVGYDTSDELGEYFTNKNVDVNGDRQIGSEEIADIFRNISEN